MRFRISDAEAKYLQKEWNGKWSDGSDELHDNMNTLNKWVRIQRHNGDDDCEFFEGESNDGTFLMV